MKPPAVSNNKKGFTVAFAALFVVFALVGSAGYWVSFDAEHCTKVNLDAEAESVCVLTVKNALIVYE